MYFLAGVLHAPSVSSGPETLRTADAVSRPRFELFLRRVADSALLLARGILSGAPPGAELFRHVSSCGAKARSRALSGAEG